MEQKKGLRGYVFSRPAEGQFAPQRMQNMVIREYVESKGYRFILSATEYYMDGCYMMLDSLIEQLDDVDGIAFFSMTFLPEDKKRRTALIRQIVDKGKELHFALEGIAVKTEDDIESLEDIIAIRNLTRNKDIANQLI